MQSAVLSKPYGARMREIYSKYIEANGSGPGGVTNLDTVVDWGLENQLLKLPKIDIRKRLRKEMANALREEYFTDRRGRTVRRYHAARKYYIDATGVCVQQVLFADILEDPLPKRSHMDVSFKQRRHQIVGRCKQLKNDIDYYNEKSATEKPIPQLWDFTNDLADAEQPTEYSPPLPQKG